MGKFKTFLGEEFTADTNETKWNVVLFAGDYDPMTKWEYNRITDFVTNFIKGPETNNKFDKNVDIGVILSDVDKEEELNAFHKQDLTLDDRKFINGKIFGLKSFPVDMKKLLWVTTMSTGNLEKADYEDAFRNILNNFENKNILIVLNPNNRNHIEDLTEIQKSFESDKITIGFVAWAGEENKYIKSKELKNLDKSGDMIKAICLLDYYRPHPEHLKYFAHKFHLQHILDDIKQLHFKVGNERYKDAFKSLFPTLSIYDNDDYTIDPNFKFTLEMLKKMYLKDDYEGDEDAGKEEVEEEPVEGEEEAPPEEEESPDEGEEGEELDLGL